ncbi:MAG: hypothetical protein ABJG41_20220 [Cyclobacteriaceae bacterium]
MLHVIPNLRYAHFSVIPNPEERRVRESHDEMRDHPHHKSIRGSHDEIVTLRCSSLTRTVWNGIKNKKPVRF